LQDRGDEDRRAAKDQNQATIGCPERQASPPPAKGILIGARAKDKFQYQQSSVQIAGACRQTVERQDRASGQEYQQRQLGQLFEASSRPRLIAERGSIQPDDGAPAQEDDGRNAV